MRFAIACKMMIEWRERENEKNNYDIMCVKQYVSFGSLCDGAG